MRNVPGQRRAGQAEAESASPRTRLWSTIAAVIAASGVLTAVTAFAVNKYGNPAIDRAKDTFDGAPFDIPVQRMLGPKDDRNTAWASDAPPPADLIGSSDHDLIGARLEASGYVAVGGSTVEIVLRNSRSSTAVITSIKAMIVDTDLPKGGTLIVPETGGGQTAGPISVGFMLDSTDQEAVVADGSKLSSKHYLDEHGLELTSGETLRINALGLASSNYVEWYIRFAFVMDGNARSVDIGSTKPFKTTAALTMYPNVLSWTFSSLEQVRPQEFCSGNCKTKFFGAA